MPELPEPVPPHTPLLSYDPERAGDYRLVGRLGAGGQGVVFLGLDPHSGGYVAVKTVRAEALDHAARERFARELAVAVRVQPFCTARVLASGLAGDLPYMVSEYIPGLTLQAHVSAVGPMVGDDLERLAVGTIVPLAAIHAADVVHSDFKPDNVILGPLGPRVIDFGVAYALDATASRTVRGYPPFMAPERMFGEPPRPACDVFAWAATIAFAASRRPPFGEGNEVVVYERIQRHPPDLAGLSSRLEDLLTRCLHRDEEKRPSAQDVLFELLGYGPAAPTMRLETALWKGREEAGLLRPPAAAPPARTPPGGRPSVPPTPSGGHPSRSFARRLADEARDPLGISAAIFLGALGGAAGYVAAASVAPAVGIGAGTFAIVFLVRLLLALALNTRP